MFIDLNITKTKAPFGGAERNLTGTRLDTLRSSERRRRSVSLASYKHYTPTESRTNHVRLERSINQFDVVGSLFPDSASLLFTVSSVIP